MKLAMDGGQVPEITGNASGKEVYWPMVLNSWDISRAIGNSPAKISVRNLQTTIRVGKDAWGREGKIQPVLISATVFLRRPFVTASVQDKVTDSTLHYGILSKAILEAAQEFHGDGAVSKGKAKETYVNALISHIHAKLAKTTTSGAPHPGYALGSSVRDDYEPTILKRALVSSLELEVTLPKALLHSTVGVSRISTTIFGDTETQPKYEDQMGTSILLRDVQVSTLIGVNPNERLAKQLVIANVELDVWVMNKDVYNQLEDIVVKTIEESTFQTLESLASHLAWRIMRYCIQPHFVKYYEGSDDECGSPGLLPHIRISLSKPTAVTMADAPVVETLTNSETMLNLAPPCTELLPFPLQGRLYEWIKEHDVLGLTKDPVLGS